MYALLRVLGKVSLAFAVLAVAAVAAAQSADKEEIVPGYSSEKLRKLKFEDVKNLGDDFKALYRPNVSRTVKWKDVEISAEEFALGDPYDDMPLRGADFLPDGMLVLKAKDKQTVLPMEWAAYAKDRAYRLGEVPEPVVCIDNGSGGNGWNANPSYIVSLADNTFLQNLGSVNVNESADGGNIELVKAEDVWEADLPWFSHASSPWTAVYYRVKDGRLEPDPERNEKFWKAEIAKLGGEIADLKKGATTDPKADATSGRDSELLSAILSKFLNERLLLGHEKAWARLQAELRYLDNNDFYWAEKAGAGYKTFRYPISEIESVLMDTLKKRGYLDKTEATLPKPNP